MSQVFISYSRKDIEFVDRLANDLKAAGFEVWYDLSGLEAGTQWGSEIQKAIETSQFFLVVLSPNSIKSSWVEREFLHASDQGKKIIPLLYQQCALPMWSLNLHFIDMQGKNYTRKYQELLKIMGIQPESSGDNPISTRYIEIGDEFRKLGQSDQAIESYTQALKVDPTNLKAQLNIGAVHLELQDYQEAAAAFELALQISGEDLVAKAGWCDTNLAMGNQARADEKIEVATGYYLEVLRIAPDEADARKSLSNIFKSRAEDLLAAGKEDQALSAFSEALAYTPQDANLSTLLKKLESEKKAKLLEELFAKTDQALAAKNWEGAIAILNDALESEPQDESILKRIELVREQQREEQLQDILIKVERAEESERWDTAIAGLNEYLQMKKDDKAVQKRMADLMASKRSTWLHSISLQVDQAVEDRNWDEALQVLNEALEIEPDNKELKAREAQVKKDQISVKLNAIILRAEQAASAGRWNDAIEILNTGLIDDPNEKILKAKLAEITQSKREEKLKSALNLADMAARTEKWETAVATLNEILASEPDNPIFLKKFDEILNLERNSKIKNLRTQAQNLVKAEKFEEALAAWNELLTLEPENRQAVLNEIEAVNKAQKLADLYFKGTEAAAEKDHLKAVEYFKRVEMEDANYKNTAKLRAKAEKRLGGEGKAPLTGRRKILNAGAAFLTVALGVSVILFWLGKYDLPAMPVITTNHTATSTTTNTATPTPTSIPVQIESINIEPLVVKNGDKFTLQVNVIGAPQSITVDLSQLDTTKSSSSRIGVKENSREFTISYGNIALNGIKTLTISAENEEGQIDLATAQIELQNPTPILDSNPPNDTFDNDYLDWTLWTFQSEGNGLMDEENGHLSLSMDVTQAYSGATLSSNYLFPGDFDIQVDFQSGEGWINKPLSGHIDVAVLDVEISGDKYGIRQIIDVQGNKIMYWNSLIPTYSSTKYITALSGKSGTLRLIRKGTDLVSLYDIGEGWVELSNFPVSALPARVQLQIHNPGSQHPSSAKFVTTYFDNFVVNSGLID